jgi:putative tricarboxylic transport membrane protein
MGVVTKEKIVALALLLFSVVYCYGSMQLKLGSLANPGPGFVPLVVAVLLTAASAFYVYSVFAGKSGAQGGAPVESARISVYLGCFLLFYPMLLMALDFVMATSLLVLVTLRMLKYRNLIWSLAISVLMSVLTFVVFSRLLGVALPSGPVEIILMQIGG